MPGTALVTINENQWNVQVATTTSELITGLSGRDSIPAGTGMLFVLPVRQAITVQTNEMLFPIDIIFIKDNLVLSIAQNIAPGFLVEEATPCDSFLEINAGEADLVNIDDVVVVEITSPPPQAPGFDFSSIISFAIPLTILGFVFGMLFEGSSSKKGAKSSKQHSNPGGAEVYVEKLPMCDFSCGRQALYDGRTKQGPWAYMCSEHFKQYGVGLGTGKGQKLILRKPLGETEKIISKPEKELSVKMTGKDLEESVSEGIWYPKCPYCGKRTAAEPDAEAVYCSACSKRFKIINPFFSSRYHSSPGIITIPKLPEEARGDFLFYEFIKDLSRLRKESLTEEEAKQLWEGWKEQRAGGHSIHGEPRRRLVEQYGSWAVGRAEAVCPEGDVACVTREAKRLSETLKARYGGEGMEYVTILSPGQTVFHIGDVVSRVALEKENRRVRVLGENEATWQ